MMRNNRLTFFNTSLISVSKSMSIFFPVNPDVSINDMPCLKLNSFPLSVSTSLLRFRSDLLPTRNMSCASGTKCSYRGD